jgi:tetratricopeptide (TPR) repeat protein
MLLSTAVEFISTWIESYVLLGEPRGSRHVVLWKQLASFYRAQATDMRVEAIMCFDAAGAIDREDVEARSAARALRALPPRQPTPEMQELLDAGADYVPIQAPHHHGPPPGARELALRLDLEKVMSDAAAAGGDVRARELDLLAEMSDENRAHRFVFYEALALLGHPRAFRWAAADRAAILSRIGERRPAAADAARRPLEPPADAERLALGLVTETADVFRRADSYARLGDLYAGQRRPGQAMMAYEAALRIAPASEAAARSLARLRGSSDVKPEAWQEIRRAAAELRRRRAWSGLEETLRHALDRRFGSDRVSREERAVLRCELAHVYLELGARQTARAYFEALFVLGFLSESEVERLRSLRAEAAAGADRSVPEERLPGELERRAPDASVADDRSR